MKDIIPKIDNNATDEGRLPAAEYNDRNDELENAVVTSGQTLTPTAGANTTQLAKAMASYSAVSNNFSDIGIKNEIELQVSGNFERPETIEDLMRISVVPAFTSDNTVTIDYFGVSIDPVVTSSNVPLSGGEFIFGNPTDLQWSDSYSAWVFLGSETVTSKSRPYWGSNFQLGADVSQTFTFSGGATPLSEESIAIVKPQV